MGRKERPARLWGIMPSNSVGWLRNVALGMGSATPWADKDDATGGYIVVRPDGGLVASYIYNRV